MDNYDQPGDYNRPGNNDQPGDYNRPANNNQPGDYNRPGEYGQPDKKVPSVYQAGAYDGLSMGLLFIAIFMAMCGSVRLPFSPLGFLAMLGGVVAVPVLLYFRLHHRFVLDGRKSPYSAMLMHGFTMMICGNLLLAIAAYAYMRLIDPSFIAENVSAAISAYQEIGTESALKAASTLEAMEANHMMPTPIGLAISWLWFGIFMGIILTFALAYIIKAVNGRRRQM